MSIINFWVHKHSYIIGIVFGCLIFFILASTVQAANLYFGSKGSAVVDVQNKLIALGYLEAGNNTGYFGTLTRDAVRLFQRNQGIVSSGNESTTGYGMVGPKTKAKLDSLSSNNTTSTSKSNNSSRNTSITLPPDLAKIAGNKDDLEDLIKELQRLIKQKSQNVSTAKSTQSNLTSTFSVTPKTVQSNTPSSNTNTNSTGSQSTNTTSASTATTAAKKSCTVSGKTIAHGEKVTMYKKQTAEINESCQMLSAEQTCDNGTLKSSGEGSYPHASCRLDPQPTLLWNPGPKYNAGLTLSNTPVNPNGYVSWASALNEAHLVGNPVKSCPNGYTSDSDKIPAAKDGSCASFYVDTRVGWKSTELNTLPGWTIWNLSGGGGQSLERTYINAAYGSVDPCELREIGLVYNHWPGDPGNTQFRPNADGSYTKLGQFDKVLARFKAKAGTNDTPPTCAATPTQKIQIDFRVAFFRPNSNSLFQTELLGITLYGMDGIDIYGKPHSSEIYYQGNLYYPDSTVDMVLLHGERVGVPRLTSSYQSYEIDFKPVVQKYIKPPAGYSLDDAVIVGLDIYASTQGGNNSFTLKDVDLVGIPKK